MKFLLLVIFLINLRGYSQIVVKDITTTSSCNAIVPNSEIEALYDLYTATNGVAWNWQINTTSAGNIWNFTKQPVNPCYDLWQGIACTSVSNTTQVIYSLSLTSFNVNGPLPPSIGNLTYLINLDLGINNISGTLPSTLCQLIQLTELETSENMLHGKIPPCLLQDLNLLEYIGLGANFFTGTIPPFGSLPHLTDFLVLSNKLHGLLPSSSFKNITSIRRFYVGLNHLSGNLNGIPSLTNLQRLEVDDNKFTGTISAEFCNLTDLSYLYFHKNYLHGPFPSCFGNLNKLTYLSTSENLMTGNLPASMAELTLMQTFIIGENYYSGSIPNYFEYWNRSQQYSFYSNYFSGSLPIGFSKLQYLQLILLQTNLLVGNPGKSFNASINVNLLQVDISENKFSGALPGSFFGPSLNSFTAFLSCFEGSLTSDICNARSLELLDLDGMTSNCALPIWPGFKNSPLYAKSIQGGIPPCVWSLPNITSLRLSGNGLTGTIPTLSHYGNLSDLDLSYNSLAGTIPSALQDRASLLNLNLVSNKFVGTIEDMRSLHYSYEEDEGGVSLSLTTNRLSGPIPDSIGDAYNIDIVEGNLFSCSAKNEPPVHDSDSNNFVCGSNLLDFSLYAFIPIGGIVALFVLLLLLAARLKLPSPQFVNLRFLFLSTKEIEDVLKGMNVVTNNFTWRNELFRFYFHILLWRSKVVELMNADHDDSKRKHVQSLIQFLKSLRTLRRVTVLVMLIAVLITTPMYYSLKASYGTITVQHSWFISGAFFSGSPPAIAIAATWVICLIVTLSIIHLAVPNSIENLKYARDTTPISQELQTIGAMSRDGESFLSFKSIIAKFQKRSLWIAIASFFFNGCMVLLLKAGCIYALISSETTFNEKVLIEIALSSVDVIWGSMFLPFFIARLPMLNSISRMKLKTCMLYFNSIFAPIIIIAIADSSCFYGIFFSNNSVEETFGFTSCLSYYSGSDYLKCEQSTYWFSSKYFQPLFIYNYECYSTIVTAYVPIFLISYVALTLFIPLVSIFIVTRQKKWQCFQLFPAVYYIDLTEESSFIDAETREKNRSILQSTDSVVPSFGLSLSYRTEVEPPSFIPFVKRDILFPEFILASATHHLIVLLTFGLLCPALAVAIALVTTTTTLTWEVLIGRWMIRDNKLLGSLDERFAGPYTTKLDELCERVCCTPRKCFSLICLGSGAFFSLALMDMAGDTEGWERALWAPISIMTIAIAVFLLFKWLELPNQSIDHSKEVFLESTENPVLSLEARNSTSFSEAKSGLGDKEEEELDQTQKERC